MLLDVNDRDSVIPEITQTDFERLKKNKAVAEGMIPKLQNAFEAVSKGVAEVAIGNAQSLHLIQQNRAGTRMVLRK